jgi:hypothetical protein
LVGRTVGRKKGLGLPSQLEALHVARPLSCGQVGIPGAVVEIPALAMLDPIQVSFLGAVTFERIGHDDTLEGLTN